MLKEFKDFLKIQNLLLENSNLTLNESAEIAQEILDIIEQYNKKMEGKIYKDGTFFTKLEINTDLSNIQKIDVGEQEDTLTIETNGKKQQIKIGRLLRQLLPNARGEDIENIMYEIKKKTIKKFNLLKNYEFIIEDNVVEWYEYFERNRLGSCMTDYDKIKKGIIDLYDLDDNIKILIIKNIKEIKDLKNDDIAPGIVLGRALIWYNTSLGKPFIDRLYVREKLNYMDIYNIMALWAEKNGYAYKGPGREDNSINNSDIKEIEYQIPKDIWEKLEWLPYMDVLAYVTPTGLLNNKKEGVKLQNSSGVSKSKVIFRKPTEEWIEYFGSEEEAEEWMNYFDDLGEAKDWAEYFINAEKANNWRDYFLNPTDAYIWQAQFENPEDAYQWSLYFNPPEIDDEIWWNHYFSLSEAVKWKKYFDNPEEANKWYDNFMGNLELVLKWKKYFNNPDEAYDYYKRNK